MLSSFEKQNLESCFERFLKEQNVALKTIAQPLRMILTGKTASPGLFEVMETLGREKVLERLEKGMAHIRNKEL